ncbi:carbohydrate sulfotransferase 3a [Vanacampus margaritifer]
MKIKYAVVFIFIVALVIIEKESNIISRVSDKMMQRQTPQQTTQSSLDYGNTTQNNPTVFDMLLSKVNSTEERHANQTEEQEQQQELQNGRKNILLMAATRTGSSFLGEMFNQHGENMFYLFEPLWHVAQMPNKTNDSALLQGIYRDVLQGLFLCDFTPLEKFLSPPPQDHVTSWLFRRYSSLALCEERVCSPVIKEDFERYHCKNRKCGPLNLTLASQSCLSKRYRVMKTVRVDHWETLQPLVEDPRLNIKIIQLVRDPRAILASRMVAFSHYQTWKSLTWDGQLPDNDEEVKRLQGNCDHIRWLAELGLSQPRWLRRRYMLVRYEDVARNPMQKAEEMYKFTGIPFSPQAREWILTNTQTTQGANDVYSTQKNSSEQAEKWRYSIPFPLAQAVQRLCGQNMKLFGYRFVDDAEMLVNKSVSLCEDRTFR